MGHEDEDGVESAQEGRNERPVRTEDPKDSKIRAQPSGGQDRGMARRERAVPGCLGNLIWPKPWNHKHPSLPALRSLA